MRLLSWNILQGGGRRSEDILATLKSHHADIITLQEFRRGSAAHEIELGLQDMGMEYIYIPETESAKEHTILIASRYGFDAGPFQTEAERPVAIQEAYFSKASLGFEFSLIAVHFPQKKAQVPLFKALDADSESLLAINSMLIGDMNCGIPFIDSDSKSFYATQHYQNLLHNGWIDSWRSRHPEAEEFTWVSPRTGNRFRYDQCLSSAALDQRIQAIEYVHEPREKRFSDHSLMLVDFE